jgi:hypothetical protein
VMLFTEKLPELAEGTRNDARTIRKIMEQSILADWDVSELPSLRMLMPTAIDIRTFDEPQNLSPEQWLSNRVALTIDPISYEFLSSSGGFARILAKAVVSTRRATYKAIPRAALLAEIGARVANTRNYDGAFKKADVKTSRCRDLGSLKETPLQSFSRCARISRRS